MLNDEIEKKIIKKKHITKYQSQIELIFEIGSLD
jgi:hypothetical protein